MLKMCLVVKCIKAHIVRTICETQIGFVCARQSGISIFPKILFVMYLAFTDIK